MEAFISCVFEEYRKISTTTISDALDKLGIKGVLTRFTSIVEDVKLTGPIFTVKESPRRADFSEFRVTEAVELAKPGSVIVFDVEEYCEASTWSGLASLSAKIKGIEGVIVNGAVRDVDEIRRIRFPVFTKTITPITGKGRIATISMNTPLRIDNIKIRPGDLAVGDVNGVVIIPQEKVIEVLNIAREIEGREEELRKMISSGTSALMLRRN